MKTTTIINKEKNWLGGQKEKILKTILHSLRVTKYKEGAEVSINKNINFSNSHLNKLSIDGKLPTAFKKDNKAHWPSEDIRSNFAYELFNEILDQPTLHENTLDDKERQKILRQITKSKTDLKKKYNKDFPTDLLDNFQKGALTQEETLQKIIDYFDIDNYHKEKYRDNETKYKRYKEKSIKAVESLLEKFQITNIDNIAHKDATGTFLREVFFKIPVKNNIELSQKEWHTISSDFLKPYRTMGFKTITVHHSDESNNHPHNFIFGFNNKKEKLIKKEIDYFNSLWKTNYPYNMSKDAIKNFQERKQQHFYSLVNKRLKEWNKDFRFEILEANEERALQRVIIKKDTSKSISDRDFNYMNMLAEENLKQLEKIKDFKPLVKEKEELIKDLNERRKVKINYDEKIQKLETTYNKISKELKSKSKIIENYNNFIKVSFKNLPQPQTVLGIKYYTVEEYKKLYKNTTRAIKEITALKNQDPNKEIKKLEEKVSQKEQTITSLRESNIIKEKIIANHKDELELIATNEDHPTYQSIYQNISTKFLEIIESLKQKIEGLTKEIERLLIKEKQSKDLEENYNQLEMQNLQLKNNNKKLQLQLKEVNEQNFNLSQELKVFIGE